MNLSDLDPTLPTKKTFIDRTDTVYGRLTVIGFAGKLHHANGKSYPFWRCRCVCGNETIVAMSALSSGSTVSCGCYNEDKRNKHGAIDTPEYANWEAMKERCHNPKSRSYPRYGGSGITVCDRWRVSFDNFLADMGTRPTPKHSVDRIDPSLGYSPENCRWATPTEQSRNRFVVKFYEYRGQQMTLPEVATHAGVPSQALRHQLRKGKSIDQAIDTVIERARKKL